MLSKGGVTIGQTGRSSITPPLSFDIRNED